MKVQIRICRHLYNMLKKAPVKGMLHSCFRSSMNMVCQYGMITFLAKGKSLQPFSICLEWNGDFKLIEEMLRLRGTELQLSDQGLWIGNFQLFEFEITQILDLKKSQTETLKPGAANFIRSFLEHQEDKRDPWADRRQKRGSVFCILSSQDPGFPPGSPGRKHGICGAHSRTDGRMRAGTYAFV